MCANNRTFVILAVSEIDNDKLFQASMFGLSELIESSTLFLYAYLYMYICSKCNNASSIQLHLNKTT